MRHHDRTGRHPICRAIVITPPIVQFPRRAAFAHVHMRTREPPEPQSSQLFVRLAHRLRQFVDPNACFAFNVGNPGMGMVWNDSTQDVVVVTN